MADDPAIRQRGQLVQVTSYAGTAHVVRGVITDAETSAGEASAPYGDKGPLAWIAYDGDPTQLEFTEYVDATGARVHRRIIKGERVGSLWNTCKLNLSSESAVVAQRADYSARDYGPDFATG